MVSHSPEEESGPSRKRQKVTRACDNCKSRKKRCTGDKPCIPCQKSKSDCTYEAVYSRGTAVPPSPRQSEASTLLSPQLQESGHSFLHTITSSHMTQTPDPGITPRYGTTPALDAVVVSSSTPKPSRISEYGAATGPRASTIPVLHAATDPTTPSDGNVSTRTIARPDVPSRRLTPELGDGQYHGPSSAQSFLGRALHRFDSTNSQIPAHSRQNEETDTNILSFGDRKVAEPDAQTFTWPDYDVATGLLNRYFEFASPTYRFMHEPTMYEWLSKIYAKSSDIPSPVAALILLMLASASVLQPDTHDGSPPDANQTQGFSEIFFVKAQRLLAEEIGPPRLESVQARFAAVQYLLSSSRPNKALFTFGTMVQLLQAVGLHRRRRGSVTPSETIVAECQKRMFWCAFTLDKYISIIMGRPPLLHREDTNQELPTAVNDEDLTVDGMRSQTPGLKRDCLLHAMIAHAKLATTLARAVQDQYRLPSTPDRSHIVVAAARCEEIQVWQSKLNPILSGAIHPSSLIPSFRRQHGVLALGRLHAIMFITRPLLLRDLSHLPYDDAFGYRDHLKLCIRAAKDAVEAIIESARDKQLYPAFWNTQYIAFNAISITYIYLVQLSRGRVPDNLFLDDVSMESKNLYDLAHTGQIHLAQASIKNAPVWRYNLILDGLSAQASKCITPGAYTAREQAHPSSQNQLVPADGDDSPPLTDTQPARDNMEDPNSSSHQPNVPAYQLDPSWISLQDSIFDDLIAENMDDSLTMDFWPHFDSLPLIMRSQ